MLNAGEASVFETGEILPVGQNDRYLVNQSACSLSKNILLYKQLKIMAPSSNFS